MYRSHLHHHSQHLQNEYLVEIPLLVHHQNQRSFFSFFCYGALIFFDNFVYLDQSLTRCEICQRKPHYEAINDYIIPQYYCFRRRCRQLCIVPHLDKNTPDKSPMIRKLPDRNSNFPPSFLLNIFSNLYQRTAEGGNLNPETILKK